MPFFLIMLQNKGVEGVSPNYKCDINSKKNRYIHAEYQIYIYRLKRIAKRCLGVHRKNFHQFIPTIII